MSRDLLNALYSGDAAKAGQVFKDELHAKKEEALDIKKVAVAADIFNKKD